MTSIDKILVPTDFSEEANYALEAAVEMAKYSDAEITLMHVVEVPSIGQYQHTDPINLSRTPGNKEGEPVVYKEYIDKLVEATRQRINELKNKYSDVSIQEHIVFDNMQQHLADFVNQDKTDLIMIGSKGASGLNEILVGSNTERIIRTSKVPVVTIKSQVKGFYPKNIVFASNFMDVSTKTVNTLKQFQGLFNATLHLVKVITPNNFETTSDTKLLISEFADKYDFDDFTVNVFNFYSEEEGIRAFGNDINADMLSMTTHGRTGLSHLLFGSIAEEVVNHAMLPVLTFNLHTN